MVINSAANLIIIRICYFSNRFKCFRFCKLRGKESKKDSIRENFDRKQLFLYLFATFFLKDDIISKKNIIFATK